MSDRIRRDQDDIEEQDLQTDDGDVLEAAFDEDDELEDEDED